MQSRCLLTLRGARPLGVLLGVGLSALMFAGSAAAATTPFGCRASTVRVTLLSALVTEPTIANPNTTPCATDTAGAATTSVLTTGTSVVNAGPVGAFTYSVFSTTGATAPGASAVAAVQAVTIPTGGGGFISIVGPVQASASYACVNDQLVANGSSTLNLIDINGANTPVPAGQPYTINLGGGCSSRSTRRSRRRTPSPRRWPKSNSQASPTSSSARRRSPSRSQARAPTRRDLRRCSRSAPPGRRSTSRPSCA